MAQLTEAAIEEDLGYFFKRLGDICFNSASDQEYGGPACALAVASTCGAVFFADTRGVYAARTQAVVAALQKWGGDGEMPAADAAAVCKARLQVPGPAVPLLSLSTDESLLAACSGPSVHLYSTRQLVEDGSNAPMAVLQLDAPVKQLCWRPSGPRALPSFVIVTGAGTLLAGTPGGTAVAPMAPAPSGSIACAAWSPSGEQLAVGRGDEVLVCSPDGSQRFGTRVSSQEIHDEGQQLQVDSLYWLSESAILVSSKITEGGEEIDISPQGVLTWQGEAPAPDAVQLAEFFAPNTAAYAADGDGPWLLATGVAPWSTVVYTHRKANDDHIKVAALREGGVPVAADITDDGLAIRIPNAPGDDDNYVVGLGLDTTSTGVPVEHPTDPNAPDLPPQPVLLVATSDGVLRAYTFGNMSAPGSIVVPPRPLPALAGAVAAAAAPAAGPPGALESKAAAVALPSEDEEEGSLEEDESKAGGQQERAAKAAAVALPSDDEESELEEAGSQGKDAAPAAPAPAPAKPLFAFATSAAPSASSTPAFGAGAFPSFGASAGSAPAFGFAAPASGAAASAPAFGGLGGFGAAAPAPAFGSTAPAAAEASEKPAPASTGWGDAFLAANKAAADKAAEAATKEAERASGGAAAPPKLPAKPAAPDTTGWGDAFLAANKAAADKAADAAAKEAEAAAGSGKAAAPAASGWGDAFLAANKAAASKAADAAAKEAQAASSGAAAPAGGFSFGLPAPPAGSAPLFGAASSVPAFGFAPPAAITKAPEALAPALPPLKAPEAAVGPAAKGGGEAEKPAPAAEAPEAVAAKALAPAPKPPMKKTEVQAPAPKLQGEAAEAAALEADFLASLHHTRKLEAEMHDALKAALKHNEGPGSYKAYAELRAETKQLQTEVASLLGRLAVQKDRFAELSAGVKDAHRKCEALPCFHPLGAGAAGQPGAGAGARGARELLLLRQPLDAPLANLRAGIRAQLGALRQKSDELQECLMALEERQRQYRGGDVAPPKLGSQQLYNAVNSQVAVAQAQAAQLEALAQRMRAAGLLSPAAPAGLGGEEECGAGELLPLQARLGALALREAAGPASGGKQQRSPWRLVKESPVSCGRRHSPLASSAGTPTGAGAGASPLPPTRLALAPAQPATAAGWGRPGSRALAQQILERVKSEEGGLRTTAPKPRPPPLALPPASPPATAATKQERPAPSPAAETAPPALPAFSLAAASATPAATAPASKPLPSGPPAEAKLDKAQAPAPSPPSSVFGGSAFSAQASQAPSLFGAPGGALGAGAPSFPSFAAPSTAPGELGGAAYFLPASSFQGAKPGYVFKLDGSGLGYYKDVPLPTAGSLFGGGKDTLKPSAPSVAAPAAPAAAAATPPAASNAPAPKQPPIPSMSQVKAAGEQLQRVLGDGAAAAAGDGGGGKQQGKAPAQEAPKPKAASKLPPIPSMAQVAQAQQLLAKVAPPGAQKTSLAAAVPAAPAAAPVGQAPAPAPPKKPPSSQPPIPSLAAAQAAQQRFESFLGAAGSKKEGAAAGASASATAEAPAASKQEGEQPPATPALGATPAAAAAAAAAPALAAAAPPAATAVPGQAAGGKPEGQAQPEGAAAAPGQGLSFGSLGLGGSAGSGGAAAAAAASPFGKGLSFTGAAPTAGLFGAAPTTGASASASSAPSLFGAASAGASSSGPGLFGASSAVSAAPALFGATAAGASSGPGLFGAAPSPASSAAGATSSVFGASPAAGSGGSLFGAAAAPAAASSGAPAFGAFGAPAALGAGTASPFGASSSSAASPFAPAAVSAPAFGAFGAASSAASPSPFGAFGSSTPFGAAGSQATATPAAFGAAFGKPASPASPFGQSATPGAGFGAPATLGFGQAATGAGFGTPATPAFGQPSGLGSGFGQQAAVGAGAPAGSVFGGAAATGGGFGVFGQQIPQQQQQQQQQQPAGGSVFGAFAQQAQQQGASGFGAFGQQAQQPAGGFGGFGGAPAAPKPGGNPALWAMRK